MPEIPNRPMIEGAAAYRISQLLATQRNQAAFVMSHDGQIPEHIAKHWEDEMAMALALILRDEYYGSALRLSSTLSSGISHDATIQQAEEWAASQARTLAANFVTATLDRIQTAHEKHQTETLGAMALGLGVVSLVPSFSPQRVAPVVVTELTRASLAGERVIVDRYQLDTGRTVKAIWRTERDSRVCPICSPLDGLRASAWSDKFPSGPPAHPNCRCSLDYHVI